MDNDFIIRKISQENVEQTLENIGFDTSYIEKGKEKYKFLRLKIHNLTSPQASIIKQTALSLGADAAVHREVITCKVEKSSLMIGGSISQLQKVAEKLKFQPFGLNKICDLILEQLNFPDLNPLIIRNTTFDWNKKTYIMGILNITPDSFTDGGKYFSVETALNHALEMVNNGVDIIDIGGESTRPFAKTLSPEEEIERIIPVINAIRQKNNEIPISVDTRNAITAQKAIAAGADIINDISGFDWDEAMMATISSLQVPVIIMHSLTSPDKMQINPEYDENIIDAIYKKLYEKINKAIKTGIKKENIIVDPGIGFGKTQEQNIEIVKKIEEFQSLNCPILMGISRKSIIAKIIDVPPEERDDATIALNSYLASKGTNIIRIHDVKKHAKAFKVLDKILYT